MDAFVGSWKVDKSKSEGPSRECTKAMAIPDEFLDMFMSAVYTLTVDKEGDGVYKYTFTMEGSPDKHVAGPFKLGEQFEFFDIFCKRTEQITITMEGNKTREVTVIKEDPSITWSIQRSMVNGEMVEEPECKGFKCKNCLKKC